MLADGFDYVMVPSAKREIYGIAMVLGRYFCDS